MPESRLNNYLNGGLFNAQQVNGDFDSEVLMIQQNSMSQHNCGPYYNYSSVITPVVDNVLPILPPNCVWMKNGSNTAIVAVQFNGGGGGGGGAILPSRINAVATFNTTTGIIQSSGINILPPDILGNVTITTQPGGTGNIVITPAGAGTVGISSIVGIFNGMTVNWFDAPNAFSVNWSAPAALAGNTTYQWPPAYPTVPTMFLASGASGVTNWVSGTIITDTLIHNAQVLGMSAAPVLILPALGAGFGYIIKSFFVQVVFSGNAFANGGVIVLQYGNAALGAGTNTISNSTANTMPANVLTGAAANQFATLVNNTNWVATATAGITNTGVYLSNQTGAFTNAAGGASSLNVSVEYMVVPMT